MRDEVEEAPPPARAPRGGAAWTFGDQLQDATPAVMPPNPLAAQRETGQVARDEELDPSLAEFEALEATVHRQAEGLAAAGGLPRETVSASPAPIADCPPLAWLGSAVQATPPPLPPSSGETAYAAVDDGVTDDAWVDGYDDDDSSGGGGGDGGGCDGRDGAYSVGLRGATAMPPPFPPPMPPPMPPSPAPSQLGAAPSLPSLEMRGPAPPGRSAALAWTVVSAVATPAPTPAPTPTTNGGPNGGPN